MSPIPAVHDFIPALSMFHTASLHVPPQGELGCRCQLLVFLQNKTRLKQIKNKTKWWGKEVNYGLADFKLF